MALETRNAAILCEVFSTTLVEQLWCGSNNYVRNLFPISKNSVESSLSSTRVIGNSKRQMANLMTMQQNEGESQEFLDGLMDFVNQIYNAFKPRSNSVHERIITRDITVEKSIRKSSLQCGRGANQCKPELREF
ncbi:hypothetical protein PanWU01x14_231970 [Parasponia andersonii]|uniref:Uncharacterized protein n=1 Tax=Parasponia andersonii TaxID=3476 RepID=A0A2P5BK97_PARAD|nr:hypothetical protein PanWU01x14_231970 [Parasponia andersonii]